MLFRTVYGPELEAIYRFIAGFDKLVARQAIHAAFLVDVQGGSKQSVDDALSFLQASPVHDSRVPACAAETFFRSFFIFMSPVSHSRIIL